jgi:adenine-specific DNA-methyltransferase
MLSEVSDFLLWYARDKERAKTKYRSLFLPRGELADNPDFNRVLEPDGSSRMLRAEERADPSLLPKDARVYKRDNPTSQGYSPHKTVPLDINGRSIPCPSNRHWLLRVEGMKGLWDAKPRRLEITDEGSLWYRRFWDDFAARPLSNVWTDTSSSFAKTRYVVQTVPKIVERAILMTSDAGDLVLDPTCGSGTSAYVAERYGRRWITIDTSRVALALARERLLTATYPFYRLRDEQRGIDGGLAYRVVKRVTASSIGYGEPTLEETFYDQPEVDGSRIRVSGPFTVEALSRYAVNPTDNDVPPEPDDPQAAETQDHVTTLLDALRKQGIPKRGGKPIEIQTLEPLAGSGQLHAEGTFLDEDGAERRFAVSLGPRFGPVTVAQVDEALHDAYGYDLVVFAGFGANAEAQDYLAKGKVGRFNVALLEANPDLLVGDLLKSTPSSQTFRLFAAPDVELSRNDDGQFTVEIRGVDSFDASTGRVTSRDRDEIAAWFLDADYDGLVFRVSQAFFPRSNAWEPIQRALKGSIEPELMEQLKSFVSLPFEPGEHGKAAVRLVDDAGTTSEAVLDLDQATD